MLPSSEALSRGEGSSDEEPRSDEDGSLGERRLAGEERSLVEGVGLDEEGLTPNDGRLGGGGSESDGSPEEKRFFESIFLVSGGGTNEGWCRRVRGT